MNRLLVSILMVFAVLNSQAAAGVARRTVINLSSYGERQTIQKERALKLLERAEKLSEKETHTAIRAEMISTLAFVYKKLGDKNKADKLLALSKQLIEKEDDLTKDCYECPRKEYFKILVAINHFLGGDTDAGLKMLDEITALIKQDTRTIRSQFLAGLAFIYAKLGNRERALNLLYDSFKLAKASDDNKGDVFALQSIAKRYASLGETDLAMQVVDSIKTGFRDHALIAVAGKYAEKGEIDRALQLNKLVEADNKWRVFIGIAEQSLKAGNKEKAVTLLDEAVSLFYAANPKNVNNSVPGDVVFLYAEAGQYDKALSLLKRGEAHAFKLIALNQIAINYSKDGRNKDAEKLLLEAYKSTSFSKGLNSQAGDLRKVAETYAIIGRKDRASVLLAEAVRVLNSVKDTQNNEIHFGEIAVVYQYIGDDENAMKTLERIDDDFFGTKFGTLLALASRYAGAEQILRERNSIVREFYIP